MSRVRVSRFWPAGRRAPRGLALAIGAAALLSALMPAGAGAVSFSGPTDFSVGESPASVVVADFNEDGKSDLAVANSSSNDVSVLLGKGDGTFGTANSFPVGAAEPRWIAVADFNGDEKPDLAVADGESESVSVLLGKGDGSFEPATPFAVGEQPRAVATGDFNGDKKEDLVVSNLKSSSVSVLLGKGDGSFETAVSYSTGGKPRGIVVADFNGDKKLDVAAMLSGASENVAILKGNGDGTFGAATRFTAGANPFAAVAGHFDGDENLDLAIVNQGSENVSILAGDGTGSFGAPTDYAVGKTPTGIASGDFDGDGVPDLAVTNAFSGSISVLLGTGAAFTAGPTLPVGLGAAGIAVGDFTGGPKPDLAATIGTEKAVSVLLGKAEPTLATSATASADFGAAIADQATLAGGAEATGSIEFALYGPDDEACAGTPVFTASVAVAGDGTYSSPAFTPTASGTYRWVASYSGDGDNIAVAGACNDAGESTAVGAPPVNPVPNGFGLGRLNRNKSNGTAKIAITVHAAGRLVLSGGKVKKATRSVAGASTVKLSIKPTGKLAKQLRKKGRAKVKVKVVFTPDGGTAASKAKTITLVRKVKRG